MAIALVTNQSASGLVSATTAGVDTTGADFLVLGISCESTHNDTPTDSKGNTWTQLTSYTASEPRVRLWYSVPTSVGSAHTFSSNGSNLVGSIFVGAFSGVKQTSPADLQAGANGTGASTLATGSITPSENNCLVISALAFNAAGSPITIDSGFTEIGPEIDFGAGDHYGGQMAYKVQTTAAAVNATWTRGVGTVGMAATVASFKASTAGGLTTVKTVNGLAIASVKTYNGLAIASVKTINGLS